MIIHFDDTELEVLVDDNSYRRRAVKEKDKLVLYYSLTHHVEIPVGAWVEYEGQVYSLFKRVTLQRTQLGIFHTP